MTIGLLEVSILLFVVFLVLGPKRLTNLSRAIGRGVRDFKTGLGGDRERAKLTKESPPENTGKRR